ncbi:MAG TPA: tetratricopeptide repeat protein [Candidatus Kapabacteria bacterium]|nr:tetratricopeptide repeat protein [Candidatus Kapabacteria bacterium]
MITLETLGDASLKNEFIGRKEILSEITKTIDEKAPAVVVKGPGGSGKTALLHQVAARLHKKQFTFILIEGETHPELILEEIVVKARKKNISDADKMIDGTSRALREKILWFVENYLQKEKIMLVFEDFETNLNLDGKFKSERLKEFLIYIRDSLKEKDSLLFFTTETDIPGFKSIPMPPFSGEEFKALLANQKTLNRLSRKSKEKLQFDMGINPRALLLLEHIASREFGEKKFEWDTLKKRIPNLAERILYKENEEADFTPLLLEKLMQELTVEQQQLLKGLSIFNRTVDNAALEALHIKIANKDRKKTVDLSLIEYQDKKDLYRIHRLTARFVLGKMSETEKKQLHLLAAAYFERLKNDSGEKNIANEIEIRRHYLEAEEWEKVADRSLALDQYLTARGFPQLAFDLLKEVENKEFNRDTQLHIYHRLALFHMIFGLFDGVIDENKKLVTIYEETGNREAIAQCREQMGMAYENKRKYDESLQQYDQAREIYEETADSSAAARTLLEIGKIHQKRGKYAEAEIHYQKALTHAERSNDRKKQAESLHQLAQVNEELGQLDGALEYYQRSQQVKENIGDQKDIATGLHHIGNIYFLKNELDTALDYYRQSLALSEKNNDLKEAGYSLGQIGMIYQRKGQVDDAFEQYKRSKEIFEKVEDQKGLSSSLHQLGRIYQDRGKLDEALEHYKKSLEIREKNADMPGMALGYGQMGMLQFERGEYEDALRSSTRAFVLFSRVNINAPGAQLARKNMLRLQEKVAKEKFAEILQEFNIQVEPPKESTEAIETTETKESISE